MSFLAFAHLARALGPDGFGKLEFVLTWMMFGVLFIESGFQTLAARDVAIDGSLAPKLLARIVPIQFCLALTAVVACYLLMLLTLPDAITSRLMFGYSVSLLAIPLFLTWMFQGQQRMSWVAVPQVLRQFCFLVAAVLLVHSSTDIHWLPYAEITSVVVAAAICVAGYFRNGKLLKFASPISQPSRVLIKNATTIALSQLLWFVRMYFPIVLIKFLLGDEAVGHFGAAHRIVNVFQVGVTVYWLSFFPQLSQHAGRPTLQQTLMKSLTTTTMFMGCCAAVISFFAPRIIQLAFGSGFSTSSTAVVLAILVWRVPIIMSRSHARNALFIIGFQGAELVCSSLSVVVLFLLSYFATGRYGVIGLAGAATVSELVGTLATWAVWYYRWYQIKPKLISNDK